MKNVLALVVVLTLGACTTQPTPTVSTDSAVLAESPRELHDRILRQAIALSKANERQRAHALLERQIAEPAFATMPATLQIDILRYTASIAYSLRDWKSANKWMRRCTALPNAEENDWRLRFLSATFASDGADAVESLKKLAHYGPDALTQNDLDQAMPRAIRQAVSWPDNPDRRGLLEALFAANWTISGREPAFVWLELLRMRLKEPDIQRADEVAARISAPQAVLLMRIDKDFDPLQFVAPARFDLNAAIERHTALLDKVAEASPRLLEPRASRIHDFVEAGHQEQAIAAADAVLAQIPTPEAARERYTDTGEWFPWLLDHRAQASARLGKWDDALEYLRRAALLPEHGGTNVSNAINLATLYADLGRTEEAIRALGELPSAGRTTSPYGRMQVQAVRLRVALAKKDSGTAKSVLDAMRANQDDALLTFQEALLVAGKLDEAAAVLIRRLQDPKLRSSALYDVQDYQQIVPSPVMKQVEARWRVLRARKDVQEAVGRVGRIEVVPLPRSLH